MHTTPPQSWHQSSVSSPVRRLGVPQHQTHIFSKPSASSTAKPVPQIKEWDCGLCDITYFTAKGYDTHLQSAQHREKRRTTQDARERQTERAGPSHIAARRLSTSDAAPFREIQPYRAPESAAQNDKFRANLSKAKAILRIAVVMNHPALTGKTLEDVEEMD